VEVGETVAIWGLDVNGEVMYGFGDPFSVSYGVKVCDRVIQLAKWVTDPQKEIIM
jgi:hypothetical protein